MNRDDLINAVATTFSGFEESDFPSGTRLTTGKVRDIVEREDELLIITSDRVSAFDRVLTTIPFKGQVLNGMSNYWFDDTSDIVANHIRQRLTPRTVVVSKCEVLPVEVVVRGYLTGSAWRDYESEKSVSGIALPSGMQFNQRFPTPLLTPSTKAERGEHDLPISSEAVVETGLVKEDLWRRVREIALALFARGTERAAERGLILVDTKYEFGLRDGEIVLVDEVHTPDSSRYWYADTYQELFDAGEKQRKIDKEYLRQWLMERGFMGEGTPPEIPDEIRAEVAERYITSYELITGTQFEPVTTTVESELEEIRSYLG